MLSSEWQSTPTPGAQEARFVQPCLAARPSRQNSLSFWVLDSTHPVHLQTPEKKPHKSFIRLMILPHTYWGRRGEA